MRDPFHSHIRSALANPDLQVALDANAERRLAARQQAFVSLPEDLNSLRRQAHSVRAETIAHLDNYLQQFTERARANGILVHQAADAAQAVELVIEIARQHGAELIAKSKTMVSEEIHLNGALEAAGLKVVETDLGEYIVQLRGERPAHIITPAVHLRRIDVGRTFEEKLGLPLTEDIPTMTAAARRVLRQTFLDADIGLSGVNFGVAESGTICLLTNEGNGRMVTTLPPVHIALMGIERLVPTFEDLVLMLALLPRHATGQKLTVYTSLIHSPRRPGDPDGPQERHLILVDNGRSAIRDTPLAEALLCIRCGACLNACPVFREIGGHAYVSVHGKGSTYPGPIGAVLSPALFGQPEFGNLARASSLCGACKEACPVDIDLPKLLLRVRSGGARIENKRLPKNVPAALSYALRIFAWIATNPWRFAAAQKFAGAASRLAAPFSGWLRLPAFTGWGYSKDFPSPSLRPFRERWNARAARPANRQAPVSASNRPQPPYAPNPLPSSEVPSPSEVSSPSEVFSPSEFFSRRSPASVLDRFISELTALDGKVVLCSPADLAHTLLDLLRARGIHSIMAWDRDCLPDGLLRSLENGGISITHEADPDIRAGLTGALAAIADTGTLVLPGGPGQSLIASLLPEIHIAVLRAQDIQENLAQVFAEGSPYLRKVQEAPAIALVTGPSRTADIEMTLTIGVHGPGEVYVFCLTEN